MGSGRVSYLHVRCQARARLHGVIWEQLPSRPVAICPVRHLVTSMGEHPRGAGRPLEGVRPRGRIPAIPESGSMAGPLDHPAPSSIALE
jgi:hypothetical protein